MGRSQDRPVYLMNPKRCHACKQDKDVSEFHKNRSTRDGLAEACKPCRKEIDRKYLDQNREAYNARMRRYFTKRKARISEIKSTKGCLCCREAEPCCLHFHHMRDKSFEIATHAKCKPWPEVEAEIAKCVVLCANCHAKVHAGLLTLPAAA